MIAEALVTRPQLVDCARSWAHTPTRHQGRLKGVAADCKGMVVGVGLELGLPEARSLDAQVLDYTKSVPGRRLREGLERSLRRVDRPEPGDVVAIMFGRDPEPRHLAILTEPGWIIHAYFGARVVAEVPLGRWRVHSCWTWPSLGADHG